MITTEIKWTPKKKARCSKAVIPKYEKQSDNKIRELEALVDNLVEENDRLMARLKELEVKGIEHKLMIMEALNEHSED